MPFPALAIRPLAGFFRQHIFATKTQRHQVYSIAAILSGLPGLGLCPAEKNRRQSHHVRLAAPVTFSLRPSLYGRSRPASSTSKINNYV
ncbi:hypothetical protein D1AOALGA4SA_12619 [Olavius algarvensis Delta 1 endosymbiont]|nr:hypothetical protein D1AOALGA4SA_12619 [Olavius algarvensis Delta 1 endosymbiont]